MRHAALEALKSKENLATNADASNEFFNLSVDHFTCDSARDAQSLRSDLRNLVVSLPNLRRQLCDSS